MVFQGTNIDTCIGIPWYVKVPLLILVSVLWHHYQLISIHACPFALFWSLLDSVCFCCVLQAGLVSTDCPEQLLIALEPEAASIYCRKLRLHQVIDLSVQPIMNGLDLDESRPFDSSFRQGTEGTVRVVFFLIFFVFEDCHLHKHETTQCFWKHYCLKSLEDCGFLKEPTCAFYAKWRAKDPTSDSVCLRLLCSGATSNRLFL